jgi:hypothetical protein
MLTFKMMLDESTNSKAIDLSHLGSKMTQYSHGSSHVGYIDKSGKSDTTHMDIHKKAKEAGYQYVHKSQPTNVGGHQTVYHSYTKTAGPYADHNLTVATRGNKVWNVEHKTTADRS